MEKEVRYRKFDENGIFFDRILELGEIPIECDTETTPNWIAKNGSIILEVTR